RPVARPRRPRDRDLWLGRMVQRRTPPRRARRPHPSRSRRRLLPSTVSAHRGMRNQPNESPEDPGRFMMRAAWIVVAANRGAGGVDGQMIEDIEASAVGEFLDVLAI